MSKSIKLSPKHGLNPTIPICFFCRKKKNQIAMLGRIDKEDSEAPRSCLMDYEPCDSCKAEMETGITLIEAQTEPFPDNRPPFMPGAYPTGKWWVAPEQFIKDNILDDEIKESMLRERIALVDAAIIKKIAMESN